MAKGGKKKLKTILIKLVSTAETGYFYLTRKNPTNVTRKIELRKYDPIVNQHVIFSEKRVSRAKVYQTKK